MQIIVCDLVRRTVAYVWIAVRQAFVVSHPLRLISNGDSHVILINAFPISFSNDHQFPFDSFVCVCVCVCRLLCSVLVYRAWM